MKKLLTLGLAVALGLIANQAFAQCASCANNGPSFSGQSYSAPVSNYSAPVTYAAPAYSQSYAAPTYSAPAVSYAQPAYSAPAVSYAQPAYSQPVYSQPAYSQPVYSQPSVPSYGGTVVSQPAYGGYSQPINSGCNACSGGNVIYGDSYGSGIVTDGGVVDGSYMGGTVIDGGSVVEGSVIDGGAPTDAGDMNPPENSDTATPPAPSDEGAKESQPAPDNGDDT